MCLTCNGGLSEEESDMCVCEGDSSSGGDGGRRVRQLKENNPKRRESECMFK